MSGAPPKADMYRGAARKIFPAEVMGFNFVFLAWDFVGKNEAGSKI
jgi:hypothetical protein